MNQHPFRVPYHSKCKLIPMIGREQFDGSAVPVSVRLVERAAQHEGVDVVTMPPLSDVIDLDALDALCQAERMHGQVTCTCLDYEVAIHGNGEIELDVDE